jgi:hypothetical protein
MPRRYTAGARMAQRRLARAVPFQFRVFRDPLAPARPPPEHEPVAVKQVRKPRRLPPWKNMRKHEIEQLREVLFERCSPSEALDHAVQSGDAWKLSRRPLGVELQFRCDDYKAFGQTYRRHPSTIRPCDATEAEVEAYLAELDKPRRAGRERERRAKRLLLRSTAAEIGTRAQAIVHVLTGATAGKTLAGLMADLAYCKAFRRPDGKHLTGPSLRKAIQREIDKIAGQLRIELEPEKHGRARQRIWHK